jgi:hypothetical protein
MNRCAGISDELVGGQDGTALTTWPRSGVSTVNGVEHGKGLDVNMAGSFFLLAQGEPAASSGADGSVAIALLVAVVTAVVLSRLLRGAWQVIAPLVRPVLTLAGALVTVIILIVVLLGGIPHHADAGAPVSPGQATTAAHSGEARQV